MTAAEIARLEALLEKATPGEWVSWDRGIGWEVHDINGHEINDGCRDTFTEHDAALIAAMKNAMPELLKAAREVERMVRIGDLHRTMSGGVHFMQSVPKLTLAVHETMPVYAMKEASK